MLEAIREALKVQSETLEFAGRQVIVREMNAGTGLPVGELGETPEQKAEQSELAYLLMFVRCVFWADGDLQGVQVFTDEDIPELKLSAKRALAPLLAAVYRVNGLDAATNAKK